MAPTAALSGSYLDRKISSKVIQLGLGIFAAAMIVIGLKTFLIPTIIIIILSGIGCGLILPPGNVLIISNSNSDRQSRAISLFTSSRYFGVLLGSLSLGAISTIFGYQTMFLVSGFILLVVFLQSTYFLERKYS